LSRCRSVRNQRALGTNALHAAVCAAGILLSAAAPPVARCDEGAVPDPSIFDEPFFVPETDATRIEGVAWGSLLDLEAALRTAAVLRANPIDVNAASLQELLSIPFLDPASAARIFAHRAEHGAFAALEDIRAAGVDSRTLESVRPYVFVRPPGGSLPGAAAEGPEAPAPAFASWSLRVRARLEHDERDPYTVRGGLAHRSGSYARFRAELASGISFGLACERDPGEARLLDHAVFFVTWENPEQPGLRVGAGDFSVAWGHGLVAAGGGFTSPGAYPRTRDRIRGYDGAGETAPRRGVYVDASRRHVRVIALYARTRLDATIDERGRVSALRSTGFHRTEGELAAAGALTESILGGRAAVLLGEGPEIGCSLLGFGYDPPFALGDFERQRFRFAGDELVVLGADARVDRGTWRAGAELAGTTDGGRAAIACARVRSKGTKVAFGFGYLSRDYWSPLGAGVPGFGGGSNGAVAWLRVDYRATPTANVWVEGSVAGRPWRSYHLDLPDRSSALGGGAVLTFDRLGRLVAETRLRSRTVETGAPESTGEESVRRTKLELRTRGRPEVRLTVWRTSETLDRRETGTLSAVGVRVTEELGERWTVDAGITAVATTGGVPSIVQYEPRLPGEFGLATLNTPGARWYIRAQAGLFSGVGLTFRLAGGPGRDTFEFAVGFDARGIR